MRFRTAITSSKEVLFVGHERANSRSPGDWQDSGRWKISMLALDAYLNEKLEKRSFGASIEGFVFCFEIADFENWGNFFQASADYVSYRPKRKEIWSVGQLRWTHVKDLQAGDQLRALREALLDAIQRVGKKRRKPKDFAYAEFGSAVEALLEQAPAETLFAKPPV